MRRIQAIPEGADIEDADLDVVAHLLLEAARNGGG